MTIKYVDVYCHHSDCSNFEFTDENGKSRETEGYAPFIPRFSGGDDTSFRIDNATGKIIGWVPLTDADMAVIFPNDNNEGE